MLKSYGLMQYLSDRFLGKIKLILTLLTVRVQLPGMFDEYLYKTHNYTCQCSVAPAYLAQL